MRIAQSIFVGSVVAVAALASPVLAKDSSPNSHANANAQAVEEAPAPQGCHAYQKNSDGNWVEMACHEGTEAAPATVHGKSASHHQADQNITR
jgi:hypothetical protein